MTTPSPKNYDTFVFIPLAAQRLQEKTISDLKKKLSDLERKEHKVGSSSSGLDGQGEGNGLGIPSDGPSIAKRVKKEAVLPESEASFERDNEEIFSKTFAKNDRDQDGDLPDSIPNPKPGMYQKFLNAAEKAGPYLDAAARFAAVAGIVHSMRGKGEESSEESESGESVSGESDSEEQEPYYIGMYYKKKVRFQ